MNADKIAGVLAEHEDWGFVSCPDGYQAACDCGALLLTPEDYGEIEMAHRHHVAAILAALFDGEKADVKIGNSLENG